MKNPPIHIKDCSKLELHIHVLGYYPKGESILVVLWDGYNSAVLRSILIDSYQAEGVNKFTNLFNQYSINTNKLDYIIWTHPDLDHSVGIPDIVQNYTNNKTKILVPNGLKVELFRSMNGDLFKAYKSLKKGLVYPVGTTELYANCPNILDYYSDGIMDDIPFSIEIVAPYSERAFIVTEFLKKLKKNDISIAFNIRFGQYRFFFGGDSTNYVFDRISDEYLSDTIFVKIPHHSSKTSDHLPDKYFGLFNKEAENNMVLTSISTIFEENRTHLPDITVLEKYKQISDNILLTNNKSDIEFYYGIWSLRYKLNTLTAISKKEGDAIVYYKV